MFTSLRNILTPKRVALSLLGALILAIGLSSIHALSDVTEGGVLGATLLIAHWTGISPAFSSVVLNAACYLFGWRTLGREFLVYSILASIAYALFYLMVAPFAPLMPWVLESEWACAIVGALFVGVGTGLCVRAGGALSGDDALAMAISHRTKLSIATVYLISDFTVLVLSLSYIPLRRIFFSLITVILSGQIIGWIEKAGRRQPHGHE